MEPIWRPLTPSDADALAQLYLDAEVVEPTGGHYDVQRLREEFELPGLNLAEASTALWHDQRLVAAAMTVASDTADSAHLMRLEVIVHPEYRTDQLGLALLGRAEHAARLVHDQRFPDSAFELGANAHENQRWLRGLLLRGGFDHARTFATMRTGLDEIADFPRTPEELPLARFEPRYDELVRAARNDTFAEHWGSTPLSPPMWWHRVTGSSSFLPELTFLLLSEQQDQVVAFVLSASYAGAGAATGIEECWLAHIGTRSAWRGRGVATALVGHALHEARARGFQRAALAVDVDNADNALAIYQRCGFEVAERTFSYVKAVPADSLR